MNSHTQFLTFIFTIMAFAAQIQPAAADAGDVIAAILLTFLGIIGVCAFLGWYSRRGSGSSGSSEASEEDGV
eukprot:g78658.t1